MKNKYLNLPIDRFEITDIDDDLAKVKIYVMHEGKNLKKSNFSKASMDDAQETIKNKPLIGVVEKDKYGQKDFKGHEVEYKIVKKDGQIDLETIYIEQPMGLIGCDNDYHYEEIDGQQWAVIDAYIWKEYCKQAYEILKESDKTVSMEIKVLESHTDNEGEYWIDKYKYLGVTLLGDLHNPAMGSNATVSLYELTDKQDFVSTFEVISDEINKYINKKVKEDNDMTEKNKEKEQFSMSMNQIYEYINKELENRKYVGKNYWGETVERQEFYLQDLLPEEDTCVIYDNKTWGIYYGMPYSFTGDVVTLDYDKMARYVVGDWRPMTEGQTDNMVKIFEIIKSEQDKEISEYETKIAEKTKAEFDVKTTEDYKNLETELNTAKESIGKFTKDLENTIEKDKFEEVSKELNEIKEKFSNLEIENGKLKIFETEKLQEERLQKENELFAQYQELNEVEGFDTLKEESSKFSLEELDTKLAVLFAKTYKNNKNKFSLKDDEDNKGNLKIPVDHHKDEEFKPYGGLFDKYSDK